MDLDYGSAFLGVIQNLSGHGHALGAYVTLLYKQDGWIKGYLEVASSFHPQLLCDSEIPLFLSMCCQQPSQSHTF